MSDAASLTGIRVSHKPSDFDRLYVQSRAEQFGFTVPEFRQLMADLLERCAPGVGQGEALKLLDRVHLDDLLLARACARGHEPSWARFLSLYRGKLYSAALAITRDDSKARELGDSLYADLFGTRTQHDGRRISKLESYLGRGSLEGWLRTVLAQRYVDRVRTERKLVSFDEAIEIADQNNSSETYSGAEPAQLVHATDTALESLSGEDRFLLAAYYLDGRALADIGRMLHLHESSVSRRLNKITSTLRQRIVKELCRAGITKRAAGEMLAMDVRDFSGDLSTVIRKRIAQERRSGSFPK